MKLIPTWVKYMTGVERGFVAVMIVLVLLGVGVPLAKLTGIPFHFSDGERTGVVVKLSKKGFFWKTWEGQMNLGAMSTDGGGMAVPATWNFSVSDETVVQAIQHATRNGRRITLHYDEPLVLPWSKGSSRYLIISTELQEE